MKRGLSDGAMPPPPGLPPGVPGGGGGAKRARVEAGGLSVGDASGDAALSNAMLAKKLVGSLKAKAKANAQKRETHADEPAKFVDSELELDEEIEGFKVLATMPDAFKAIVRQGGVETLLELLGHENLDIASRTLEVVKELTEPDALLEDESAIVLAQTLVKSNVLKYLLTTIDRILVSGAIPDQEEQEEACYNTLLVVDNLIDAVPDMVDVLPDADADDAAEAPPQHVVDATEDLLALLLRIMLSTSVGVIAGKAGGGGGGGGFTALKGISCELLSTLLQACPALARRMSGFHVDKTGLPSPVDARTRRPDYANKAGDDDFINGQFCLLKCLSAYIRGVEETSEDEVEYVENLYDALCSVLLYPEGKEAFLHAQGTKLLLLLILPKKKKKAKKEKEAAAALQKQLQHTLKHASLKCFAYALQGSKAGCAAFLETEETSGLGVLCGFLMMALKKGGADAQNTLEQHVLGILTELVVQSKGASLGRIAGKFAESSYEKTDRLVELYLKNRRRLASFERDNAARKEYISDAFRMTDEQEEGDRLAQGGLATMQAAFALAFLSTYDKKLFRHAVQQLQMNSVQAEELLGDVEISAAHAIPDTAQHKVTHEVLAELKQLVSATE